MTKDFAAVSLGVGGTLCCCLGWIGWIIGPRELIAFGVVGFLCGMLGLVVSRKAGRVARAGAWLSLRFALRTGKMAAGTLAVICIALMLASAWDAGVADYPALEARARYELNNHGVRTVVPRWRYVLVSVAFGTGWHAMAALANMIAMPRRLYGEEGSSGRLTSG